MTLPEGIRSLACHRPIWKTRKKYFLTASRRFLGHYITQRKFTAHYERVTRKSHSTARIISCFVRTLRITIYLIHVILHNNDEWAVFCSLQKFTCPPLLSHLLAFEVTGTFFEKHMVILFFNVCFICTPAASLCFQYIFLLSYIYVKECAFAASSVQIIFIQSDERFRNKMH